ncbi:glycosyltransferase family 39 protein [Candidatus Microgenomates bacterium]|nr:glycosyltransferase family 39 protein [Candidatus Microgenomates bacterium]
MKKVIKNWWLPVLFLFVLVVVAFVIRIYHLTILPVFADEAIYIRWSQIMAHEPTLRFLPLSDGKQPLFMWILMFVVSRISDPLVAGRLLSIVSGLGTIIGIFLLSYYLFKNKWISLIASSFWIFSPYSFFFDRMALVDSLLALFIIWTAYLASITAKTKRLDMAMLTGFALGFASLTKSPALFAALLIPSSWILSNWPKSLKGKLTNLFNLGLLTIPTYLIALAMYNIQRLGPNFNMLTSRTQDYVFPISHLWLNPKDPFIFLIDRAIEWLRLMGPWPFLILVIVGLIVNFKKQWKEKLFLFSWWVVPTLIQTEFAKVFTARYELYTIAFLFIIAASAFTTKVKYLKIFCVLIFALWLGLALRFDYLLLTHPEKANLPQSERSGYLEEWTAGTGIRQVSDFIKQEHLSNPNEKIVIGTEGYFGTLPDGLQIYLQDIPNVTVIGVGLDFGSVPDQLKVSAKSGTKTYFVANSSRMKFKNPVESYGLKIIKTFQKADRKQKDTHEYLWFGPYDTFYLFEVTPSAI